jgi:hypothetical protein
MAATAIHIVPDDNFDDWVVRNDDRHEIGHYPTREEAELAAQATARGLQTKLVVHLPDGRTNCTRAGSRDCSELDPTGAAGDRHTLTPSTWSRAHASNWGNDTAPDWRAISLP